MSGPNWSPDCLWSIYYPCLSTRSSSPVVLFCSCSIFGSVQWLVLISIQKGPTSCKRGGREMLMNSSWNWICIVDIVFHSNCAFIWLDFKGADGNYYGVTSSLFSPLPSHNLMLLLNLHYTWGSQSFIISLPWLVPSKLSWFHLFRFIVFCFGMNK